VAYDQFPSQNQIFYESVNGRDMWYDPVFRVETVDGRNVWAKVSLWGHAHKSLIILKLYTKSCHLPYICPV